MINKVLSIVGARPQFIKAGIISKKIRQKAICEILVHTGQHYDYNMSDVFFEELQIPKPDYNLSIGSLTHGHQTGMMLMEIEKVLINEKPDIVIVYGDTNSTLAGALSASKLHISVAHVEAGLRSYNKKMPEEINRVLTDHVSTYLFVPTKTAEQNLAKEGIVSNVYNVGDVMYDVALEALQKVNEQEVLDKYSLKSKNFVLVTVHRAENTDNLTNFINIWNALNELATRGIVLFFPVHPRTRKVLVQNNLMSVSNNLIIAEPVSYFEMLALEKNAKVIITDSGGVQKEGYFLGTPCVVVREETEWVELVEIGFNSLVGCSFDAIMQTVFAKMELSSDNTSFQLYGNGKASERIVEIISKLSV